MNQPIKASIMRMAKSIMMRQLNLKSTLKAFSVQMLCFFLHIDEMNVMKVINPAMR